METLTHRQKCCILRKSEAEITECVALESQPALLSNGSLLSLSAPVHFGNMPTHHAGLKAGALSKTVFMSPSL